MKRFEGKVVIVTGASSGIGAATARRFLAEGALVIVNGRREHKLRETIAGFDDARTLVHPGDVSQEAYVERLVKDSVDRFGKLDVLVNNAGMAIFKSFAETTTEDWRKTIGTDLDSVYFASREALPHLLRRGDPSSTCPLRRVWAVIGGLAPTTRRREALRTSRAL